jgi:hypothetical protein
LCKTKICSPNCKKCAHPLHGATCPYYEISINNRLRKKIAELEKENKKLKETIEQGG